jgi:hypothetical protein
MSPLRKCLSFLQIRKHELKFQSKNSWIKTINIMMVFGTPPAAATTIFACYEIFVGRLPATLAFTSLSLFNVMRFPLVVLPKALRALSEAIASIQRIEEFLVLDVEYKTRAVGTPGVNIVGLWHLARHHGIWCLRMSIVVTWVCSSISFSIHGHAVQHCMLLAPVQGFMLMV